MNAEAPTRCALPAHADPSRELARTFVASIINAMKLNRDERAALIHAPVHFCKSRDERGILIGFRPAISEDWRERGGWSGPREVEYTPAAVVNGAYRAACWISALRGKKAKRGDRVLAIFNGVPLFGRVVRISRNDQDERCLRVVIDDDQPRIARYSSGSYGGHTICAIPESDCAILAR